MAKLLRGEAPVKIPIQLITIQRASYREGASLWQEAAVGKPHSGFITGYIYFPPVKTRTGKGTRVLVRDQLGVLGDNKE